MTSELSNTNAIADDALQLEPAALFVESYFPEQISACAEAPQGHSGSPASWTRANPWLALAAAFGAGAALAMISAAEAVKK